MRRPFSVVIWILSSAGCGEVLLLRATGISLSQHIEKARHIGRAWYLTMAECDLQSCS